MYFRYVLLAYGNPYKHVFIRIRQGRIIDVHVGFKINQMKIQCSTLIYIMWLELYLNYSL